MTGREKIRAALSPDGSPEFGVAICYEGIYVRDCWEQLTDRPWWAKHAPELEVELGWRRDVLRRLDHDFLGLGLTFTRQARRKWRIDVRDDGSVVRVDLSDGRQTPLHRPAPGEHTDGGRLFHPPSPQSIEEIDRLIEMPLPDLLRQDLADGAGEAPAALLAEFGRDRYPIGYAMSPMAWCTTLWGIEGFYLQLADREDLVAHATRRFAQRERARMARQAAAGCEGVFIEECYLDLIHPDAYRQIALPAMRELTGEIRRLGMHSIHYFCGNPNTRWDLLLDSGADALSLEESKKNFRIDIAEVAGLVDGRCALVGNIDAVGILQQGSDEQLEAEIARQVAAGRANRSRFIVGLGSPVTPSTPVSRVQRFCQLARRIGSQGR